MSGAQSGPTGPPAGGVAAGDKVPSLRSASPADGSGSKPRSGSLSSATSLPAVFLTPGLYEGGPRLRVLVCSCNVGNAMPTDLSAWLPKGGGHYDVIAVGMQESTFRVKVDKRGDQEQLRQEDDLDDDEEDDAPVSPTSAAAATAESATQESFLGSVVDDAGTLLPAKSLESLVSTYQFEADGTGFLKELLQSHLGEQYIVAGSVRRLQMRLRVYVHRALKSSVTDVSMSAENTGIAGLVANKGGLAVSFKVEGTTLCFVSCHLAAHEGAKYLKQRHLNVQEIINGARPGNKTIDLDHQFHHVFWTGDMNYRLDPSMNESLKDLEWSEQRARVLDLIKSGDWESLNGMDELQRELLAGNVLCGFQTAPCLFPPTFKPLRYSVDGYNEKRMPSYCDRVLWKSMPGLEKRLEVSQYTSCPGFLTSDHKPIRASFEVTPTPPLEMESKPGFPRVTFFDLAASELPIMDVEVAGSTVDPYLVVLTEPAALLLNKEPPRTEAISKNQNPKWKDHIVLLPAIQKKADMTGAHVILMVMDWDFGSADDCVGFALISLDQIRKDSAGEKGHHEFELELLKGGLSRGWVRGKAKLEWPKDGERFRETTPKSCKCLLA